MFPNFLIYFVVTPALAVRRRLVYKVFTTTGEKG